MHYSLLVGVLLGGTDLLHQHQALRQRHPVLVAEPVQGRAPDELHHEVRQPSVAGAALEDLRYAVVVHPRQRLTLVLEARHHGLAVHAELDQLERDEHADRLLLLGEVDGAHAAFAQGVEDAVGTDLLRPVGGGPRVADADMRSGSAWGRWGFHPWAPRAGRHWRRPGGPALPSQGLVVGEMRVDVLRMRCGSRAEQLQSRVTGLRWTQQDREQLVVQLFRHARRILGRARRRSGHGGPAGGPVRSAQGGWCGRAMSMARRACTWFEMGP